MSVESRDGDNYNTGKVVKFENIPIEDRIKAIKDFAEGSEGLESCLLTLSKMGLFTSACCKGNHLGFYNDEVIVSGPAYIAFEKGQDWKDYLFLDILKDDDVVVDKNVIYYFGEDHELFFQKLNSDFLTGKKDNKQLVSDKMAAGTAELFDKLDLKSYIYTLMENGFSQEQIEVLSRYLIELIKLDYRIKSEQSYIEKERLCVIHGKMSNERKEILTNYFNENTQSVSSERKK